MDIPPNLIDTTTLIPNHSVWAHFGCVSIRVALAMFLWTKYSPERHRLPVTLLSVSIISLFAYKFWNVKSWKVFARVVFTYATVLTILYTVHPDRASTIAGLLVFMDAMMGLQSRFTATLLAS
jgi:hypothetical protein